MRAGEKTATSQSEMEEVRHELERRGEGKKKRYREMFNRMCTIRYSYVYLIASDCHIEKQRKETNGE